MSDCIQRVVRHEYCALNLYDGELRKLRIYALDFPAGQGILKEEVVYDVEGSAAGEAFRSRQPIVVDELNEHRFPSDATRWLLAEGIRSACWIPLITNDRAIAVVNVASRRRAAIGAADMRLLNLVAPQIAIAVENALAFEEIEELKDKLSREKGYLEDEIRTQYNFEEMVGESPAWRHVIEQIATVAPTDATVLILGESGTGKELVARAIHSQSRRRERTFVKVSCAALPTGLLESELFGHEKGAFTGALTQQIGRFELANKGTLLLDEVGDVSLELQPKLLRALQEQEFERLGNPRTLKVDVRVVAATNRNLPELMSEQKFREDLFYRLNVFPIVLPPLRDRATDIELLARHFAAKHAARLRKHITSLPAESLRALTRYRWPGNVRELEHLIERAVILSRGPELRIPVAELRGLPERATRIATLQSAERDHILQAVRASNGIIGGPNGAAAKLGINRTTLNSRMRKLGISRKDL